MRLILWGLLAIGVHALPKLSISKRDTNLQSSHIARGLIERDNTVGTNMYDVLTWTTGGEYYANVTVGTPPQDQVVIIGTAASDLYFDASSAAACKSTGLHSCRGGTFSPEDSSSCGLIKASPAFNISFSDGSTAVGPFAEDIITIGDVRIDNVQFGLAQEINSTTGYTTGFMGLGYREIEASSYRYPNIPEVLEDAGLINSRLYSIYLNDADETGTILFGGIDTSKYNGVLATLDLLPYMETGELLQFITTVTDLSASVAGKENVLFFGGTDTTDAYNQNSSALPVILDTGSSAWNVPSNIYQEYIAPAFTYVDQQGLCSCSYRDSNDSLSLTFGATIQITVPAREFIIPLYNSTTNEPVLYDNNGDLACVFMINPSKGNRLQTLGHAILRSMYVVFDLDNGQVSIAQANVNSSLTPDIVTVPAGPSGIALAIGGSSYSAAPSNSWSAASYDSAYFLGVTAESTIGTATGTGALPADAQPSQTETLSTADSGGGGISGSGGSTSSGDNGGTGSSTSSIASGSSGGSTSSVATGLASPGADWSRVFVIGIAMSMVTLGASLIL